MRIAPASTENAVADMVRPQQWPEASSAALWIMFQKQSKNATKTSIWIQSGLYCPLNSTISLYLNEKGPTSLRLFWQHREKTLLRKIISLARSYLEYCGSTQWTKITCESKRTCERGASHVQEIPGRSNRKGCRNGCSDTVEKEYANRLSELTNVVAIGLVSDVFVGDDLDYTRKDKPIQRSIDPQDMVTKFENAVKSKRLVLV